MRLLGAPLLTHRATTAHVGAAYPWMAEAGLGSRGVYVGRDLHGGAFCYDPWELYPRVLTGPNLIVIGELGRGKSALIKSYVFREIVFGRRALMLDPKGENARLCEALGVQPVRLQPGGPVRLNPLDPRIAGSEADPDLLRQEQLAALVAIVGASLGRRLLPQEETALELALRQASRGREEPTLREVVEALLRPEAADAHQVASSASQVAEDGRQVALALRRLCDGQLRGMFDGPTSEGIDLGAPLVSLDLSAVYHSEALDILMICAAAWLQRTLARDDHHRRIVVIDEAWVVLKDLQIARWMQSSFKLSRALGVQNVAVVHRVSDLLAAGTAGSEQVELARGLLRDAATQVIYQQPAAELDQLRQVLHLSEAEVREVLSLPRGVALWRVGDRRFLVMHLLSPVERWIVDTDQRMTA
ncbi:MAG TPA: ATP-binding protein [Candidatus Dormibacteraeota bacterium]|nr:ATP-binding protein [Candidatus Dormibacteraeota bacterium]